MDAHDIRFRIAAARRMLFRLGCDSNVGGHVSARADGEDAFWVTGFEYFDQTTPDRVAKLDFDLRVLEGELSFSPAVNFHNEQVTYFDDGHRAHVEVADALGEKRVVLIKNHGAIIASQSLENAT